MLQEREAAKVTAGDERGRDAKGWKDVADDADPVFDGLPVLAPRGARELMSFLSNVGSDAPKALATVAAIAVAEKFDASIAQSFQFVVTGTELDGDDVANLLAVNVWRSFKTKSVKWTVKEFYKLTDKAWDAIASDPPPPPEEPLAEGTEADGQPEPVEGGAETDVEAVAVDDAEDAGASDPGLADRLQGGEADVEETADNPVAADGEEAGEPLPEDAEAEVEGGSNVVAGGGAGGGGFESLSEEDKELAQMNVNTLRRLAMVDIDLSEPELVGLYTLCLDVLLDNGLVLAPTASQPALKR